MKRYEYLEMIGTSVSIEAMSTKPEVIDWIEEQVKQLRIVEKVSEFYLPSGDRYRVQIYVKKDRKSFEKRITVGDIKIWLFQQLCQQGWEPLDWRHLRLEFTEEES